MKKTGLLLLVLGAVSLHALTIADGTQSDYQIVVPDATSDKALFEYIALGGKVIQKAIRQASGAQVPVVTESEMARGRKCIYVGNTRALGAAGLSSASFTPWEHAIVVKGNDVYCYGKDLGNPYKQSDMFPALKYPTYSVHFTLSSLKAACVFAEKFANTRFVIPSNNDYGLKDGVSTLPLQRIEIPDDFSYRRKIRFTQQALIGGLLFSVANGFYFSPGEAYNVHYHVYSIPQDKYYKDHPEYFALVNGKRLYHEARPQYCLSNPEVQKLIYDNALERVDIGYKVIEFGQSDGFIGCECENCKAMYGTSDWGEKLWCLHRDMAARLVNERPGVIPAIACYGPTHQLPKSFDKFPTDKMIIDVAPATKELVEGWKRFNISGMAAWTYYFGSYNASSFAPACDFEYLQREMQNMHDTPVTYLYNCGIRNSLALEGPWVYAYGKFNDDPNLDAQALLVEYCSFAFGEKAAEHFVKFFNIFNQRSKLFPTARNDDFNDFNKKRKTSTELWHERYTPEVLATLQDAFNAGKSLAIPSEHLDRVERELAYVTLTANVNNAVWTLQEHSSQANRQALAEAIEKRDAFLNALPQKNGRCTTVFEYPSPKSLKAGGSMAGVFTGAFNSDPAILKQEQKSILLTKVNSFEDSAWDDIQAQTLAPLKSTDPKTSATFKAAFSDTALLLKYATPLDKMPDEPAPPRDSSDLWKQPLWEIFLATGTERFHLAFSAQENSAYDACIYQNNSRYLGWNPKWQHKDTIKDGVWTSEVTLPFKAFQSVPPADGSIMLLQSAFSTANARQLYSWNIPLSGAFSDVSGFGIIHFGTRTAPQSININGNFDKDRNGKLIYWSTSPNEGKCEIINRNGKNALRFTYEGKTYSSVSNGLKIPVGGNDQVTLKVRVSGKGHLSIGGGWSDGSGKWVVNEPTECKLELSETPVEKTLTIHRSSIAVSKNGFAFRFTFILKAPGGELIIEEPEVEIQ